MTGKVMTSAHSTTMHKLRTRIVRLETVCDTTQVRRRRLQDRANELSQYLLIAPAVEARLDRLSDQLFGQLVAALEQNLSVALQEVLDQPLQFKVERSVKHGTVNLKFFVERNEQPEDVLHGQGGSVANVLSVGLRFFALATLDEMDHRRFLVLDEQDCWLRPDLVPKMVKIVHDAGRSLGFQILLISHHEIAAFSSYADRIYQFVPTVGGVEAKAWDSEPLYVDEDMEPHSSRIECS